jgi:hypothetical protein
LDKFQIEEFAMGIELGDEAVVVGSLCLAVHTRDVIALLEGIVDEAIRRLQFRHGDLGIERAGDHKGDNPDNPCRWMSDHARQKRYQGAGSDHKIDGR